MQKIEHIGIAVKNIENGEKLYNSLFNSKPYKREIVESQKVITSFYKVGPNKIELVAPLEKNQGTIAKYVEKHGEGVHHVAYAVIDIRAEMKRLKNDGFELLYDEPRIGADNKLVCFIHPKSAGGCLVELCQESYENL